MEKGWKFCPACGSRPGFFNFGSIFQRMKKEMEEMAKEMDKSFEKDMEAFDISPFFRQSMKPHKSGFTIRIVSGTGMEPKVEVRTFGDIDREKITKQIGEHLGYKTSKKPVPAPGAGRKRIPTPKITEEPATQVRRLDSKVVVEMELPGVRREEDIEIRELESSVEVKAIAGDKGFFKILTKPEEFSLVEKRFSRGRLHLEFA
jgi:HSP20 family molecular chaperone IbpA